MISSNPPPPITIGSQLDPPGNSTFPATAGAIVGDGIGVGGRGVKVLTGVKVGTSVGVNVGVGVRVGVEVGVGVRVGVSVAVAAGVTVPASVTVAVSVAAALNGEANALRATRSGLGACGLLDPAD
jgi:hypothetical protein